MVCLIILMRCLINMMRCLINLMIWPNQSDEMPNQSDEMPNAMRAIRPRGPLASSSRLVPLPAHRWRVERGVAFFRACENGQEELAADKAGRTALIWATKIKLNGWIEFLNKIIARVELLNHCRIYLQIWQPPDPSERIKTHENQPKVRSYFTD